MRTLRPAHVVFLTMQIQELHTPVRLTRTLLAIPLMVFNSTINCSLLLRVHQVLWYITLESLGNRDLSEIVQ